MKSLKARNEMELIQCLSKLDLSVLCKEKYFVLVFNKIDSEYSFSIKISSSNPKPVSFQSTRMNKTDIYCVNDFDRREVIFSGQTHFAIIDSGTKTLKELSKIGIKTSSITFHNSKMVV